MRNPIFIRPLTEDEQRQIQAGLRSSNAFVLRRCQILLASARGQRAPEIAEQLGCNASWHQSKSVRSWIRQHNIQVANEKTGVRILPLYLPTKSPWLNPIEPKWAHGKRNVVEKDGLLTAKELVERVSAYYGSHTEPYLAIPEKVA